MNWMDVVDTAIKIGLGAMLAGIFALISSKVNNRHQLTLSREERLQNALEEISQELESTLSSIFTQGIAEAHKAEDLGARGYDLKEERKWWERVEIYITNIDSAIATVNVIDGKLKLNKCVSAANKLSEISDFLLQLPEIIEPSFDPIHNAVIPVYRDKFKEINEIKATFYDELNKDVKKIIN